MSKQFLQFSVFCAFYYAFTFEGTSSESNRVFGHCEITYERKIFGGIRTLDKYYYCYSSHEQVALDHLEFCARKVFLLIEFSNFFNRPIFHVRNNSSNEIH